MPSICTFCRSHRCRHCGPWCHREQHVPSISRTCQGSRTIVAIVLLVVLAAVADRADAAMINATSANYKSLIGTLQPGDTLNLAAGTYPLLSLGGVNGTASAWITIQGPASGAPAIITVNPANPGCCNLIEINNSACIALKNLRVDSALVDAIFGVNATSVTHDILIEGCTFVGQGSHQQTVAISTKGTAWNWTIRGNTIPKPVLAYISAVRPVVRRLSMDLSKII